MAQAVPQQPVLGDEPGDGVLRPAKVGGLGGLHLRRQEVISGMEIILLPVVAAAAHRVVTVGHLHHTDVAGGVGKMHILRRAGGPVDLQRALQRLRRIGTVQVQLHGGQHGGRPVALVARAAIPAAVGGHGDQALFIEL